MNTTTLNTTEQNNQAEPQSDLLKLLSGLSSLMAAYLAVARTASQANMLKIIADEAEFLTRKLTKMHARWSVFLPFHENIDVNFEQWADRVNNWIYDLRLFESNLPHPFLLDVINQEPISVSKDNFVSEATKIIYQVDGQLASEVTAFDWEVYCYGASYQDDNIQKSNISNDLTLAANQLKALANALLEIHNLLSSELTQEQFQVLANRLAHRDCQEPFKEARQTVNKRHNTWPPTQVKKKAERMKTDLIDELKEKYPTLPDYVSLDEPVLSENGAFGQFLFISRQTMSKDTVRELAMKLKMIIILNTKYINPKEDSKEETMTKGRPMTDDESKILKTLDSLPHRVVWHHTTSPDRILDGIHKMLGVDHILEPDMMDMCNKLWGLFKKRKNCDSKRSLQVTWLNIVGWCKDHDLLTLGAPTLCKEFFPKCDPDDYKAINKTGKNTPKDINDIEPLLVKYLLPPKP